MKKTMNLSQEQIDFCMECGVCTGSCPVSRMMPSFSPRQMIKRTLMDQDDRVVQGRELWSCLTCGRCSARCPAQIDFPGFVRAHREKAWKQGILPQFSHHGTLQAIAALQTREVRQRRTDWAREAGQTRKSGEYFYFVGCAPYFEAVIKPGTGALEVAKSIIGLLNRLGIEPVISDQERCCGHDALWSGDEATFRKLAEINLEIIRSAGAKTVLFSCPEGYTVFKDHMPRYFGELPFEVLHLTEFFSSKLSEAGLTFKASGGRENGILTYQDPCRLGRGSGIYEAPRELLRLIEGIQLVEMERNRENALCCGTSAWMECSNCSKALQNERLQEAREAGAQTIITACPKCRIHFVCAQENTDHCLTIADLYSFLWKCIA